MHARGFVGSGRGGTDEKESRRKASTRTEEEGRVYKEQEEGRNEGRGNGGRRGGTFKRSEKKRGPREECVARRERGAEIICGGEGRELEEGKTGRRREKGGGEKTWNKGKFRVWRQCVRVMSKGREKGERSGSGSELWQHMRARDSHGAPFVRVSATQLVTVCTYV